METVIIILGIIIAVLIALTVSVFMRLSKEKARAAQAETLLAERDRTVADLERRLDDANYYLHAHGGTSGFVGGFGSVVVAGGYYAVGVEGGEAVEFALGGIECGAGGLVGVATGHTLTRNRRDGLTGTHLGTGSGRSVEAHNTGGTGGNGAQGRRGGGEFAAHFNHFIEGCGFHTSNLYTELCSFGGSEHYFVAFGLGFTFVVAVATLVAVALGVVVVFVALVTGLTGVVVFVGMIMGQFVGFLFA